MVTVALECIVQGNQRLLRSRVPNIGDLVGLVRMYTGPMGPPGPLAPPWMQLPDPEPLPDPYGARPYEPWQLYNPVPLVPEVLPPPSFVLPSTPLPSRISEPMYQPLPLQPVGMDPNILKELRSYDVNAYANILPKPNSEDIGQIARLPSSLINPVVIPYGDLTGLGGDVHDTFKIDRYDNAYGGHTSIKIPGVKPFRFPWEE